MAIQVHFVKLNCIETEDTVHASSHMMQTTSSTTKCWVGKPEKPPHRPKT